MLRPLLRASAASIMLGTGKYGSRPRVGRLSCPVDCRTQHRAVAAIVELHEHRTTLSHPVAWHRWRRSAFQVHRKLVFRSCETGDNNIGTKRRSGKTLCENNAEGVRILRPGARPRGSSHARLRFQHNDGVSRSAERHQYAIVFAELRTLARCPTVSRNQKGFGTFL